MIVTLWTSSWGQESLFAHYQYMVGDIAYMKNRADTTLSVTYVERYKGSNYLGVSVVVIPSILELGEITYPVTAIGEEAFSSCTTLALIDIPNSVTSIGRRAFSGCTKLTSVYIPDSVTTIGDYAFENCTGLTSVKISNSVKSIGEKVFSMCYGLTSISIPRSVDSIDKYAFWGCSGLERIVVEEGNAKYDSRMNCNAIIETSTNTLVLGCKKTVIPNSVAKIGACAFLNCCGGNLQSITIPKSVTSIDSYAFDGFCGITKMYVQSEVPIEIPKDAFGQSGNFQQQATLYVPVGSAARYRQHPEWGRFNTIEETSIH